MRLLAMMLAALLPFTTSGAQPVPADAMNQYFDRLADFGGYGAIVVMRDGKVVYRHGFGLSDRARRTPLTPASGIDIASIGKHFTALAILQLEERGALNRADTIGAYIDNVPPDKRAITIQQLLTHRSGLPAFFIEGNDFTRLTRDEALPAILRAELEFKPGTDEGYSDAGFTLLAIIAEKLSGQTIEELIRREQFDRAGMSRTHSYGTAALTGMTGLARGYLGDDDRGTPANYVRSADYWVLKGAGGVISTADDLAKWETALAGGKLLNSRSRAAYFGSPADSIAIAGEPVALPSGKRATVITGAQDFGFAAAIVRYADDGTTVIITSNRQPQSMDISFSRNALVADVDAFLFGKGHVAPPSASSRTLPSITSTYRLGDSSTIRVERDGEFLVFSPNGALATELLAYGDSTGRGNRLALSVRSVEIVEKICRGDASALNAALVRPSERYESYIRTTACADSTARVRSAGSMPKWWTNPPGVQPATILEIVGTAGTKRMRFEWTNDKITALGGGGMEPPATPFSSSDRDGELVGYHVGIRAFVRVRLSHATLEFAGAGAGGIARRVP